MIMTETIEAVQNWFAAFVAAHPGRTPLDASRVELKRRHCELVRDEALALARSLELTPRQITLAAVAGLCHDVGRFPQYQRYKTFSDPQSANHGLLGSRALLRRGGFLPGLTDRERALVRLAVVVHNRRSLPPVLAAGRDPQALVLAQIIRDADKLDILRIMIEHFNDPADKDDVVFLGLPDLPGQFNPAILDDIEAGRSSRYDYMHSATDFALLLLSWINDLAFPRTRELFFSRGHVRQLFAQLPDVPRLAAFKIRYHERFAPTGA